MNQLNYNPSNLLDTIKTEFKLKNDSALARFLNAEPPRISKIRNRKHPICPTFLIQVHEATGWDIKHIRHLMGDDRPKFYRLPYGEESAQNLSTPDA